MFADGDANRYYEDALERHAAKDYDGAIIQLKNALKQDRQNLPARILLGRLYLRKGMAEGAEMELSKALSLGADEELVLVPLGYALLQQGKYDEVLRRLKKANRSRALEGEIQLIRAKAQFDSSDLPAADESFQRAAQLLPAESSPVIGTISVLLAQNRLEEAGAAITQARETWPHVPELGLKQAQYLHLSGDLTGARTELDSVLTQSPELLEARRLRAAVLIDLDQPQRAIDDLVELRKVTPSDPNAIFLYALALAKTGDHKLASDLLHTSAFQLSRVAPEFIREHAPTKLSMGIIHYLLNRYEEAEPFLRGYLNDHPNHLGVRKLLASIAAKAERHEEVMRLLSPAIRHRYADQATVIRLARAQLHLQQADAAIELLESLPDSSLEDLSVLRLLATAFLQQGEMARALELVTLAKEHGDQYQTLMALGFLQLQQRQLEIARITAEQLVKLSPERPEGHNFHGAILLQLGAYEDAERAFEKAISLKPVYPEASLNLAKLAFDRGDWLLAEQRYKAILGSTESATASVMLAKLMLRQDRQGEAIRYLEKVAGKPGIAFEANFELVKLYLAHQQPEKAIALIARLERSRPGSLVLTEARAQAYMAAGDPDSARRSLGVLYGMMLDSPTQLQQIARMQIDIEDFEGAEKTAARLMQLRPDALDSRLLVVRIDVAQNNIEQALSALVQLQQQFPGDARCFVIAADLLGMQGNWNEAEANYQQAMNLQPSPYVITQLFKIAWNHQRQAESLALLERWIEQHSQDHPRRAMLANAYMQLGQTQKAVEHYLSLLAQEVADGQTLNNLALLLSATQPGQALEYAQQAYQAAPGNAAVLDTYGWLLAQQGEAEKGLAFLRKAYSRASRNPQLAYHLGATLKKLQRNDEAIEMLEKALLQESFAERQQAIELLEQLR